MLSVSNEHQQMTPAVEYAKKHKINFSIHQFEHDKDCTAFGEEAANQLGIPTQRVFKTLVVELSDHSLGVILLPACAKANLKLVAKAFQCKKAVMAQKHDAQRSSGYVVGGISPLGQKRRLPTIIDVSAKAHQTIFVSAGQRGLEIEIAPMDLSVCLSAQFVNIAMHSTAQ